MEKKNFSASTQMSPDIYKDFYKTYYNEKLKVFNIFAVIAAVILILAAMFFYYRGLGLAWSLIELWVAIFLLIYPRRMYRKPYKRAKDTSQTTHFEFFDDYMSEKTHSRVHNCQYKDIKKIIETKKYFFIFLGGDNASIIDKSTVENDASSLSSFLKSRTECKVVKRK
jgi:hypothetical protein